MESLHYKEKLAITFNLNVYFRNFKTKNWFNDFWFMYKINSFQISDLNDWLIREIDSRIHLFFKQVNFSGSLQVPWTRLTTQIVSRDQGTSAEPETFVCYKNKC